MQPSTSITAKAGIRDAAVPRVRCNGPLANQKAAFERFRKYVDIARAHVLEIGGLLPSEWTSAAKIWSSVDPLHASTSEADSGIRLYRARAESLPPQIRDVDAIFACDSFQHVNDVVQVYEECARVLKPGGVLYANFGPVWTAPDGAHIENVIVRGRRVDFWSGAVLPAWAHLLLEADDMRMLASQIHGDETGAALSEYIETSTWINRIPLNQHLSAPFRARLDKISLRGCSKFGYRYKPVTPPPAYRQLSDEAYVLEQCYRRYGLNEVELRVRDLEVVVRKPAFARR